MRPLNRLTPKLPPSAMKTYQLLQPKKTHFKRATCEESGCGAFSRGWKTQIDESTELGQRQAYYIRKQSGRRFREERNIEGLTDFIFEPGQRCFQSDTHVVSLEREPFYFVKNGDFRQSTMRREHKNAADWVDDFASHQEKLATEHRKG